MTDEVKGAVTATGGNQDRELPTRMRRDPVQARSRDTVERILDAAEALVDTGGVPAATTRAIAERAGVAAPSLYRFFTDRDQILDRLLERHLANLDAFVAAAEEGWEPATVQELVDRELGTYLSYYEDHPSAVRLWFGGRISDAVVAKVRERNRITGEHLHQLCVRAGLASSADALTFRVLVEIGDRVLDLALRDGGGKADPAVVGAGAVALSAYLDQAL